MKWALLVVSIAAVIWLNGCSKSELYGSTGFLGGYIVGEHMGDK